MASTIRQEQTAFNRVMRIMSRKPHPAPQRKSTHRAAKQTEQLWAAAAAPNSFWANILSSH